MVTVSYSGVHQAYQIALAAQEAGSLDCFLCSFYDAPGKWGGRLSRVLGTETLRNRRVDGLDARMVVEYPWPELGFKLRGKWRKLPANTWIGVAQGFDQWAARRLMKSESRILVCSENCAYESFRVAKDQGMTRIYDCPGHNAKLWQEATQEAARRTRLPFVALADTPEVTRRKELEIGLADVVLTYSDFHTAGVMARGVPREQIAQTPLWTDPDFWTKSEPPRERRGPLRVLFVGGINLRKGVPFLVEAVRGLVPHATLTLVGSLDPDAKPCLAGTEHFTRVLVPVNKERLREIYRSHDVLVLPSLGDSFGFVAMEAMACGLPVILTTHCGAPVPAESWRVPVMDPKAIRERLRIYLDQSNGLCEDAAKAELFAKSYTPARYRAEIGRVLAAVDPR